MSKLTELLKQHNLSTTKNLSRGSGSYGYGYNKGPDPAWVPKRDLLIQTYGAKVNCETNYAHATIKCKDNWDCAHYVYTHEDQFAYNWPGQGYLLSKMPIPIDIFHEICKVKKEELEAARKKRFETIKSPRDAVRILFRDLNIKNVSMVGGSPRLNCGPFDIEFAAGTDNDPKVEVAMVYQTNYVNKIKLITLSVADPDFNKKVEAIVANGQNLNKLMLGEIQPVPLPRS